jgi:hypothetical protein
MPTTSRVSYALADVGHLSLAAAGQNLAILWVMSRLVFPGVTAFCAFAAIAVVMDFVFHVTFFVAVLSVDVRRLELQDSLDRANEVPKRTKSPNRDRRTWGNALLQGDLPVSTRIAGSVVTMIFIASLNWHFFDQETEGWSWFGFRRNRQRSMDDTAALPPINLARTPSAWLKLQPRDNAQEVIEFIRPSSHSFITRIYDPLSVVMENADRSSAPSANFHLLSTLRGLMDRHIFPIALIVVFLVAIVTLLMNYLLWTGLPDNWDDDEEEPESVLTVKNLLTAHTLDVVKLQSCSAGHMVSVSLDKTTCIWYLDSRTTIYSHSVLRTAAMTPSLWPISACAVGECGLWLALCTGDGTIALWSYSARRFVRYVRVDMHGYTTPSLFQFLTKGTDEAGAGFILIIITQNGEMTEIDMDETRPLLHYQIGSYPISRVLAIYAMKINPRLLTFHRNGEMRQTVRENGQWSSSCIEGYGMASLTSHPPKFKPSLLLVRVMGAVVVAERDTIHLLNWTSYELIYTFKVQPMKPSTLRLLHPDSRTCPSCGAYSTRSITLAYTDLESNSCVVHTYTPPPSGERTIDYICLRPVKGFDGTKCNGLGTSNCNEHIVEQPGVWEATKSDCVIGVRRVPKATSNRHLAVPDATASSPAPGWTSTGLRQRIIHSAVRPSSSRMSSSCEDPDGAGADALSDEWEAWTLSSGGDFHRLSLRPSSNSSRSADGITTISRRPGSRSSSASSAAWLGAADDDQLYVTKPGPIAPAGRRSVAVGLGNSVKIISVGSERFERASGETDDWTGSRKGRRKGGRKPIALY